MNDYQIFKKASRSVKASLLLFFLLFVSMVTGTWFLLNIDLFAVGSQAFSLTLILISIAQSVVFALLFWHLAGGSKSSRIFFWLGVLANFALFYFPISSYKASPEAIYTWLAWAACLVIEDVLLYNVGIYIFQNHACKIFYDKVVEVDEEDAQNWQMDDLPEDTSVQNAQPVQNTQSDNSQAREQAIQQAQQKRGYISKVYEKPGADRPQATMPSGVQTPPLPKDPTAKPRRPAGQSYGLRMQHLAVRLGICVYGEMILFPILVSIFSDYFVSSDMKNVFATRDIFLLCIASAMIWTIAIFILYYAPAWSKKAVLGCWLGEVLVNVWYIPRFLGYYHSISITWPIQVFIFFAILDLLRYALILLVSLPVFQNK